MRGAKAIYKMVRLVAVAAGFALLGAPWTAAAGHGQRIGPFYVSPEGNNANNGSDRGHAWRTIQHAADALRPGQAAMILAGTYDERVWIKSSGTLNSPITLQASRAGTVRMRGFSISGSHWVISSFDISVRSTRPDGYGIYIYGSASHDVVRDNQVHELCHEGIYLEPTVSNITISGNRIRRAEMAGINIDGKYVTVSGNEIWDTLQHPSRLGGIYSGCDTPRGADADGMRFFGQHHLIAHNYIHDIHALSPANPDPHVDCFQTWGSDAMIVDDVTFAANRCRWPNAAAGQNHAAMLEGSEHPVGTLRFVNNVFANMSLGIIVGAGQPSGVGAIKLWNNTFAHILKEALIFSDVRSAADEVINNIFYDVGSGGDSYLCLRGGDPIIKTNDFYMPHDARLGTYCSNAPYLNLDPLFVNSGDQNGIGADYHLRGSSPPKDRGTPIPGVAIDYDATARPAGTGWSIGAFQR